MFTGIIEELGAVDSILAQPAGARLKIRCRTVLEDIAPGASIAVNGVCLTAVDPRPDSFSADVSPETLRRSNLGELRAGSSVNLERPLSPSGRLGGHIVLGHVDGTGEFLALDPLGDGNWWLTVRVGEDLDRYVVEKGSIAIDGISLTVASAAANEFAVSVIPHTLGKTTLSRARKGTSVNLEFDLIGKYVESLQGGEKKGTADGSITPEKLRSWGYNI